MMTNHRLLHAIETVARNTAPAPRTGFKTQERPNPWVIVSDYAKTAITVAAALLAFSVPFYKEVLGQNPDGLSKALLLALWVAVAVVAVASLVTLAHLSNFLRQTPGHEKPDACVGWAGCSFWALGLSLVILVALGIRTMLARPAAEPPPREQATKYAAECSGFPVERLAIAAVWDDQPTHGWGYRFCFSSGRSDQFLTVIVNAQTGALIRYEDERFPPPPKK